MTILKNCILRYIYNIQNSSSRWDATAKLYFFTILSPQIYDLMDKKTKYINIWLNWPNIVIEWAWRENHI